MDNFGGISRSYNPNFVNQPWLVAGYYTYPESTPAKLTTPANFGPNQDMANDDVDDFDGALQDIYRRVGTDSLGFRVESYVTYASENDPSQGVTGPTKYKKVTVKVYSLDLADADTVQIAQTLSCKNACNW